jgi:hypothetical protein
MWNPPEAAAAPPAAPAHAPIIHNLTHKVESSAISLLEKWVSMREKDDPDGELAGARKKLRDMYRAAVLRAEEL